MTLTDRVAALDLSMFAAIPSQTTDDDKRSLLLLEHCIRTQPYTYVEIGSHLGGTLQPHYVDPQCRQIVSIDPRPKFVPDVRGRLIHYADNSTAAMLALLQQNYPSIDGQKVITFDAEAHNIPGIPQAADLCFIDGEHTIPATLSDFTWCRRIAKSDAVIVFHDANVITEAILDIQRNLTAARVRYKGVLLAGAVYALLLDGAIDRHSQTLSRLERDANIVFPVWQEALRAERSRNRRSLERFARECLARVPWVYDRVRAIRNAVDVRARL